MIKSKTFGATFFIKMGSSLSIEASLKFPRSMILNTSLALARTSLWHLKSCENLSNIQ
jgi:hypothetical protein